MISRCRYILLLVLLSGYVSVAFAADKPVLQGFETRITTNLADQFDPSISGNLIVYTDLRGVDADIYLMDGSGGFHATA